MNFVTEGLPVCTADARPSSRSGGWFSCRRYEPTENNGRNSTVPLFALHPQSLRDGLPTPDDLAYMTDMGGLLCILRAVWVVGVLLAALAVGATVGYGTAGWIGGICLGVTCLLLAGLVAGPGGLRTLLQALRLLEVA